MIWLKKYQNNISIVLANIISRAGSTIYQNTMNAWVIMITGNPKILGLIHAFNFIPTLILNLFAGYFADNYNRKKIIIITDILSAIASIVFSILINHHLMFILILNVILAVCNTIFSPALRSIIPGIIRKEEIKKTNAILSNLSEIIRIIAPSITVYFLVSKVISFELILVINGISFLLSALITSTIRYQHIKKDVKFNFTNVKNQIKEGIGYILKHKDIFYVITFATFSNFFMSGYYITLPYYSIEILHLGKHYGYVIGIQAIGAMLSGVLLFFYKKNLIQLKYLKLSIIVQSLAMLLFMNEYSFWAGVLIFGFALAFFNVLFFSYIQLNCDSNYLGRVFSVIYFLSGILIPVGSFVFGFIVEYFKSYIFIILAIGFILSGIRLLRLK